MTRLAALTIAIGAVLTLIGTTGASIPGRVREWVAAFPRSRWAAGILAAIALFWSGVLVNEMSFGRFEHLKPLLWLVGPIIFVMVVFLMEELLAPRALGGILLLVPDPVLAAARWHPSPLRYVVIVLAYFMVIVGMAFVLSPFLFRRWVTPLVRTEVRCRVNGVLCLSLGLFLLGLGFVVY